MRPREVSAIGLLFAMLGFLYAPQDIALFSINGAFFVFPFFACGVFLRRHEDEVNGRYWLIVTGLLIVTPVLFGLYAGLFGQQAGIAGRYTLQALAIGLSACTLIVLIFPPIHLMAAVGRRSFTIYLFHTVFASVANRLVQEFYSLIALSLVLGIVGPVIIDGLIKNRFTMLKPLIGEKLRLREAV
jgi:peptidoglycan/LPS O-acetylase OafA/YrhL